MYVRLLKFAFAFFFGVLAFTPLEILLARFGLVEYGQAVFLGVPPWLPLGFGTSGVMAVILFKNFERLLQSCVTRYNPSYLAVEYLLLANLVIAVLLFHTAPYLLSVGLLAAMLLRLFFFHREWDFLVLILGAALGPTVELILTSLHFSSFTEPDFLGIPYWLPLLWGQAFLMLRRLAWVVSPVVAAPTIYSIKL